MTEAEPSTPTAENTPALAPPAAAVLAVAELDPRHPLLHTIQRVVSEQWTDAPEKLARRQRVRIVEAKFKYPLLRLEEDISTDPATGKQTVTLLRASVADHLMIGLKPGADPQRAAAAIFEKGYTIRAIEEGSFVLAALPAFAQADDQKIAARDIAALEEFIDHAEPDYIVFPCLVPNDPAYSQGKMWGLHNPGSAAGTKADADIDAPEAWDVRTDASSIVVAVTDTGIQYNHQDLLPNMWTHPTNGSYGFDAYDSDNDPMDVGGHGTHCAGTIGGRGNNGIGMTGVAWQVKLMGVRFLGPNGGSTSDSIRAVNYARQNGAHIISASWGGGGFSQSLYNAIKACGDAGIPFVAAAGNSSTNNDSTPHYPSSYDLDTIVSVASTTSADALSTFSCFGRNSVDIAAPGSDIWSAYIGSNTTYKSLNGTSMATPHVSGALALAMAQFPTENVRGLIRRLYASVDKISSLSSRCKTGGRLNLAKLLESAATPPEADAFATAYRFDGYYGEWVGSNEGATRETSDDLFDIGGPSAKSLWFAFRTPHSGLVTLDFNSDVPWYSVVIYEGSVQSELKLLQISDLFGGFNRKFTFTSKADTEYRILLATNHETRQLFLVKYGLTPPNDMFADATIVNGEIFSVTSNNRSATSEPFEKNQPHAKGGQGKSVWWRWTAPTNMNVTLNTRGSAFDTVMAVYTGSSTSSLTEIAANDDRNSLDWTSQVQFAATAGTTYHIAVDSFREDAAGDITLNGFRSGTLTILRQPVPVAVELGKRAVFEVSALSNTDLSYQWFLNDQAIPGQTSSNLVIDPVRLQDLGNYKVHIWSAENTVISQSATLSERQIAPKLLWSSGNQAVAAGTAITFSANFSGSTPLTYTWTKNGQSIGGSGTALSIPSPAAADSGTYRLTASNSAGTATAEFSLSVIASPWDRWEWRRPGVTNAAITDIKVYGGEAFAVSATNLLRSTDGINWNKTVFPEGFSACSIAKAGSLFMCLGVNPDNQFRAATSTNNGATWTISSATGFTLTINPGQTQLTPFGSGFIAYNHSGAEYLRSTNGTAWTRLKTTNLGGQLVDMTGRGLIASNGSKLVLASSSSGGTFRYRYHKSTDGINWREYETQAEGEPANGRYPNTAYHDGTKFHLFSTYANYTSADGDNWSYFPQGSTPFSDTCRFASNGNELVAFVSGSQMLVFYDHPGSYKTRNLKPANSHLFTAAATFGNKLLYGTDKGRIGLADGPYDVAIPNQMVPTLSTLEFTENLFIARTSNSSSSSVQDHVSGDGLTWKMTNPLSSLNLVSSGSAFGKYYATQEYQTAIYSGHNPFDYRLSPADDIGVAPNITFIGQLPNGNALAISTPGSSNSSMLNRLAGSTTWSAATFPLTLSATSKFAAVGNRWFSGVGSMSAAAIYTSTDGASWTNTNLTGSNTHFAVLGANTWCVYQSNSFPMSINAARSTNGTSWTGVTPSGLPGGHYNNFIKRVVAFNNSLVLLGTNENLYYSSDGITWFRGFAPAKIVDIAVGQGQLIAITKNGGIIQTGSAHAGRNAPQVAIVSPQPSSTHLIGSRIGIEGTLSDQEDGTATYDAYLDGQLVVSGSGNKFQFFVNATNLNGHTVTVRVRDSQGLRQIDAIRLNVTAPEARNSLTSREGIAYIPHTHVTVMDGIFYTSNQRNVYRSTDGKSWQSVSIPSFANTIYGITSGNGSLVIQFDNGGIITTRDGVNWTHFQPNRTSYWVREPVRFSGGIFIAAYQTQGTVTGSIMTSTDGLRWETGAVSEEGYLEWSLTNGTGVIIGASGYLEGFQRTTDHGFNWAPITQLAGVSRYNSKGIFADGLFQIVATGSVNKIFRSEDALTWSAQALPFTDSAQPAVSHAGGLLFVGTSNSLSHASAGGGAWQAMTHRIQNGKMAYARGLFVAQGANNGLLTSRNGLSWTTISTPGMPNTFSKVLANDSVFLVIDNTGGVWTSADGAVWSQSLPGGVPTATSSQSIGRSIAEINGRIVVSGQQTLVQSTDNGLTWQNATVNGLAPSGSNTYHKVVASNTEMLVTEGSFSNPTMLHRSTNGMNFTSVTGLPAKTWVDMAWNGSVWMLLASDGTLLRSTDGALTWSVVPITGMPRGAAIAWFNQRWVIIGAATAGFNTPYAGFSLGDDGILQNHGTIGFFNSSSQVKVLMAHGKILIWQRGESTFVSSTGTSWSKANISAGSGNNDYDIHHTPEGFTGFVPSSSAYYPVRTWKSNQQGMSWSEVPSEFNNIQFSENLGSRIFIFASSYIAELNFNDLALTIPNLNASSMGVGDLLTTNVRVTNFGRTIPVDSSWKVTAWLAKNRYFGDGKSVPLGICPLIGAMPNPGGTADYPVSFTLPNDLRTGANYVILVLSNDSGIVENNLPNNTAFSDTPSITIPEWSFSVLTNGNGQVNRDFAAMRYPHKAQVSLTATAGKGATFTGWSGDGYSPNNQITILMDGNKTLAANFSNRATLQVFVRGAGSVDGVADQGSYALGASASLTAAPASGWEFSHWSDDVSSTQVATSVVMNEPKVITAHFILPVATWKSRHFSSAQLADAAVSGDNQDPDGDGLKNWQEYLHSSHPLDARSRGMSPVTMEGGMLRCLYTRNLGAVNGGTVLSQASRDLTQWNAPGLQERVISTVEGVETIEVRFPSTAPRGFLRMQYHATSP